MDFVYLLLVFLATYAGAFFAGGMATYLGLRYSILYGLGGAVAGAFAAITTLYDPRAI